MHKTRTALRSLANRLAGNEDGVVAIEFGVVASFLILMLIGATDLGFAARHRSQMEGAVRAGIQEAMKGGTEEAVETAVSASTDLPKSPAATISATKICYDSGGDSTDCEGTGVASIYMEIVLEQEHKWILGMPGFSNPSILKVTNSVRVG
jgi:Flp pilus assembly protein TadG